MINFPQIDISILNNTFNIDVTLCSRKSKIKLKN